jgi:carbon monoxide dehydrogenase subunit G
LFRLIGEVVKALMSISAVVFFRFPALLSPGLPLALKVKVNAGALGKNRDRRNFSLAVILSRVLKNPARVIARGTGAPGLGGSFRGWGKTALVIDGPFSSVRD